MSSQDHYHHPKKKSFWLTFFVLFVSWCDNQDKNDRRTSQVLPFFSFSLSFSRSSFSLINSMSSTQQPHSHHLLDNVVLFAETKNILYIFFPQNKNKIRMTNNSHIHTCMMTWHVSNSYSLLDCILLHVHYCCLMFHVTFECVSCIERYTYSLYKCIYVFCM